MKLYPETGRFCLPESKYITYLSPRVIQSYRQNVVLNQNFFLNIYLAKREEWRLIDERRNFQRSLEDGRHKKDPSNYLIKTVDNGEIMIPGILLKDYAPGIANEAVFNEQTNNYEFRMSINKEAASKMFNFYLTDDLELDIEDLLSVTEVAEKYQITRLKPRCHNMLIRILRVENCIEMLRRIMNRRSEHLEFIKSIVRKFMRM